MIDELCRLVFDMLSDMFLCMCTRVRPCVYVWACVFVCLSVFVCMCVWDCVGGGMFVRGVCV